MLRDERRLGIESAAVDVIVYTGTPPSPDEKVSER
jgi:hypothetical protein